MHACLPQHACGGQGNARDLDLFPRRGSWRFSSGHQCLCLMSRLVGPDLFLTPKGLKSLSNSVPRPVLSACSTAVCPHGLDTVIMSPHVLP